MTSRLVIPVRAPSFDGRYWGNYPHGDKPETGAELAAAAQGQVNAAAQLSTAIRLAAAAQARVAGSGGMSSGIRFAASAVSRVSASAAFADSNALVHGEEFVVTGSGFGTKSGHDHRWDDASGDQLTDTWDYAWPYQAASSQNIAYRTPEVLGRGVALPHNNITRYICGCHAANQLFGGRNVLLGVDFPRANNLYSRWEWYARLDPAWKLVSQYDNHKFYGIAQGSGSPYSGGSDGKQNWYLEFRGAGDFPNAFQWHVNDDAEGVGISKWGNLSGAYGGEQPDPRTQWVKRSILMRWHSSSSGLLYAEANYEVMFNDIRKTDGYAGTARSEAIEGYSGGPHVDNWRYMADIYYDRGPNDAALYLTNNAIWAASTIKEIQPWSSWSDSSITCRVNKGQLSSGAVHVHLRSIVNGHQYLGTRTVT